MIKPRLHSIAHWLAPLLLLWLVGCASLQAPPIPPRPPRIEIQHYAFDGALTIHQGERAWRIGISWQHQPERDQIILSGPLGQGLAEITRDAQGARLVSADGKTYQAADAQTLLLNVLGIPAPIDTLPRWLLADIDTPHRDPLGRPLHASESGWQIEYGNYESPRADALPQQLKLERDDLSLQLRIDQWQLD